MSRPSNRAADHALCCVQAAVVSNMRADHYCEMSGELTIGNLRAVIFAPDLESFAMHQAGSKSGTKADAVEMGISASGNGGLLPRPRAPGLPSRGLSCASRAGRLVSGRAGEGGRSYGASCIRQLLAHPNPLSTRGSAA